jgi:hypothetical protein
MRGTPIGRHETLESQIVAQNLERALVAARVGTVDAIVRAHDRRDARTHCGLEWREVNFVKCLIVHPHIRGRGIEGDEVFDHGHDALRLDTANLGRGDPTRQQRILTERIVGSSKRDISVDVDEGLQGDVDAEGACFASDHQAVLLGDRDVERGSDSHGGRFRLCRMAGQHPRWPIGEAQSGNTEAWHAGQIPCLALVLEGRFARVVYQLQFFGQRHAPQQLVHAGVPGDDRRRAPGRRGLNTASDV